VSEAPPHPPLLAALRELSARIPPERVDRIWLFPPRRLGPADSALAVLSLLDPEDPSGRRVLVTVLTTTDPVARGPAPDPDVVEHGSIPADRVERLLRGVLERLKDEREIPRSEIVHGDPALWRAAVGEATSSG
jgi:hypothetical protein